jgi:molybdopterin converting factor small subunit
VAEVLVRFFAAAAEAAGRDEELIDGPATVGELKALLIERHGSEMARVLAVGSFLVGGVVSRDDGRGLEHRVDVLPPFAGG